ncbi:chaplin [Kitasatospora sp. NPDC101801]|uniref:chaplin n=1 Tax=Kitasatospora sp. NPDC101801 TaxID=3364103 RepID=UPI00380491EF
MRQVAKRGILTAVATGSVLASASGYAYASSDAQGVAANSPGVGSGNNIQAPVDIPVNACGNTVSVVGLLNPAMGNDCANGPGPGKGSEHRGADAHGSATNSPGVLSGNNIQAPVSVPINACGNSANVVGIGNPAFGNDCGNVATPPPPAQDEDCHPGTHSPPPASTQPPGTTPPVTEGTGSGHGAGRGGLPGADEIGTPATGARPVSYTETPPPAPAQAAPAAASRAQLAQTGSEGLQLITVAGAALLLGGGVLYRRSRVGV